METGMIVITTILLSICTLPFIFIIGSKLKRENRLKNGLNAAIAEDNGSLSDYTINNNFILGLDSKAKQFYCYKNTKEAESLQKINLHNIKSCEVIKESKRVKNGKSSYDLILKVALEFTSKTDSAKEEFLLYDDDESAQLNGEQLLAATWKNKVMDLLAEDATNPAEERSVKRVLQFA